MEDTKLRKIIKFLIDDEYEAIDGYDRAIEQIRDVSIREVLEHIRDEEKEHIQELKDILEDYEFVNDLDLNE